MLKRSRDIDASERNAHGNAEEPSDSEDEDFKAVNKSNETEPDGFDEFSNPPFDGQYVNKQRVLVFCSRGVTARARHLLEDLRKLLPHHKKEMKLDAKDDPRAVNEIAEIKTCNSALFLEARKRSDLYMWASKTPNGPSVKFLVSNVNTMDELRLTGNAMMGSRPLLSFDRVFDCQPHYQLLRAILTDIFGTPRGHPKSKPFIDRVMSFHVTDGRIWVRNFQVLDVAIDGKTEHSANRAGVENTQLVEIGPRFVLTPIRIFAGSFGGPTLFMNRAYISPNEARSQGKRIRGTKYASRRESDSVKKARDSERSLRGQLDDTFR